MEHAQIRSAFNDFLRSHEATLTPTGFLHWVSVHQPALVEALGTVAVMTFAAEYLATPLRSGPTPAHPLRRRIPAEFEKSSG